MCVKKKFGIKKNRGFTAICVWGLFFYMETVDYSRKFTAKIWLMSFFMEVRTASFFCYISQWCFWTFTISS